MAKKRKRNKKHSKIFPKWIRKYWGKNKYYTKNWFLFLNTLALFLLCNAPLLYLSNELLAHPSITRIISHKLVLFIVDVILLWILLVLNYLIIFPVIINNINRYYSKRKSTNLPVLLTGVTLLFFFYFYQEWNIDLIVNSHKNRLTSYMVTRNGSPKLVEHYSLDDFKDLSANDVPVDLIRRTPISSTYGRFLRTYRWNQYIRDIEEKYGIEPYLLAGLIMQESYGNPLQLNSGNDGGAGLMMFQPGTARAYGLRVYGNSTATGRDVLHGKSLRNLLRSQKYDYDKISQIDERFHVVKSMNAGARFLAELYSNHRTWDRAISAYNRGTPAVVPEITQHVRQVRYFQEHYKKNLINYENQ